MKNFYHLIFVLLEPFFLQHPQHLQHPQQHINYINIIHPNTNVVQSNIIASVLSPNKATA